MTLLLQYTLIFASVLILVALGGCFAEHSGVINLGLEGIMIMGALGGALTMRYLPSDAPAIVIILSVILVAAAVGMLYSYLLAVACINFKADQTLVGTALNLLVGAITTFLLYLLFGLRGKLVDNRLMSLTKINLPLIRDIPFIGRVLENLTIIDYLSYIIAVILFVYLYKTVAGFRTLSVGINKAAAESLGTKATRIQMEMVILSGALCGLGGVVLSMGQVTMFTENMTSGRGFIAMAAASLGMSHPLLVIAASLFFGLCQGIGLAIQNVVKSQLTNTLPYIATIVALVIFSKRSGTKLKG